MAPRPHSGLSKCSNAVGVSRLSIQFLVTITIIKVNITIIIIIIISAFTLSLRGRVVYRLSGFLSGGASPSRAPVLALCLFIKILRKKAIIIIKINCFNPTRALINGYRAFWVAKWFVPSNACMRFHRTTYSKQKIGRALARIAWKWCSSGLKWFAGNALQ